MANHSSAKKAVRQIKKRTVINRDRMNRIRTFIKKVETAITGGDKANAQEALRAAQSEMMRGVKKSLIKLNSASRKISRLAAKVKALAS
jgi:small subunit ribosomal protein S20